MSRDRSASSSRRGLELNRIAWMLNFERSTSQKACWLYYAFHVSGVLVAIARQPDHGTQAPLQLQKAAARVGHVLGKLLTQPGRIMIALPIRLSTRKQASWKAKPPSAPCYFWQQYFVAGPCMSSFVSFFRT